MTSKKLAQITSVILGPVWLPILILAILAKSNLTGDHLLILLTSLFILEVLIPLFYLWVSVKTKMVSAWDLPKRPQRYRFFGLMIFTTAISLILIHFLGNDFLFYLTFDIFLLSIVLGVITLYWKISLHAAINTMGALLVNYLFSWQFPLLFLAIPIIFWDRLKLKRHTFAQLFAGTVITAVFIIAWALLQLPR